MLSKILLTALVIVAAYAYIRRRQKQRDTINDRPVQRFLGQAQQQGQWSDSASDINLNREHSPMAGKLRLSLWLALLVLILIGGGYSLWHWQSQQQEITVLLYASGQAAPTVYRVPRKNLGQSSFITSDGTLVQVSANERMEVIGL
ncbi:hypothetical protein [Pseudohongiella spirulinae]|uniref:Uncharacterized protein n=1 Tax=Pseudohongiella spirulinae TaxID=1249552 RepID=A0A0S2KC17_9GAMM|nr:hypothetical protein [Pseudohongiella spirulinae]ALO45717.1 hypothetical protein PS2015_1052 [Pseudohongiella spirulinae]